MALGCFGFRVSGLKGFRGLKMLFVKLVFGVECRVQALYRSRCVEFWV